MKVITSPGKTPQLIQIAAERGGYIVCADTRRVAAITHMAREMDLKIAFPLTFDEFVKRRYHGRNMRELYIDEVGDLARALALGLVPIHAITVSEHPGGDAEREVAVQETEIEALRVAHAKLQAEHAALQTEHNRLWMKFSDMHAFMEQLKAEGKL